MRVSPRKKLDSSLVFVDKTDVLDDIIEDVERNFKSKNNQAHHNAHRRSAGKKQVHHDEHERQQFLLKCQKDELLVKQNIKKQLEMKQSKNDERFIYYLEDLEKSNEFLNVVEKNLNLYGEAHKNKIRRQFEDWNENVHGKIQMNIAKQVDSMDSKQLNKLKNEDYAKFLDITNKKAAIFRDIIIESEYDPLEPNRRAVKAKVPLLNDPTHIDEMKARKEAGMLGSEAKNDSLPIGKSVLIRTGSNQMASKANTRETLPVELWASGKIDSTPYGSFAKMMSSSGKMNDTMRSNVQFNDFDYPRGKEVLDAEMPPGKRIIPQNNYPFGFGTSEPPPPPEEVKTRVGNARKGLELFLNGP